MKTEFKNIHGDLIELCRLGDSKAQFKIYKLYYKAMYNTCLWMIKDSDDAEEIMQNSFLSAFDKIDTYKGEVSFGAWLKKIVVNNSINFLRKKKLEFSEINDNFDYSEDDESEDNGTPDIDQIKNAINMLPEGYRVVLCLYLLEGYDHNEISQILDISVSTSRSQFLRAKKKLISLIKENNISIYA